MREKQEQPEKSMGPVEAALTGVAIGVSEFAGAMGKVWDAAAPMFNHGRDEAASVLFTGSGHVMYGWGREKDQQDVSEVEAPKTPEVQQEAQQEKERGGREM